MHTSSKPIVHHLLGYIRYAPTQTYKGGSQLSDYLCLHAFAIQHGQLIVHPTREDPSSGYLCLHEFANHHGWLMVHPTGRILPVILLLPTWSCIHLEVVVLF